uniref:Uncharacterized protein n=1 Tax=Tanacetum cinerariifolium TaxID=118510 RepID=A0A6L2NVS8_TANCI|nr:hypothetical protein [Tanacetum cinerariifolium]
MEIEPDIENMMLNEYWGYEAEKERQLREYYVAPTTKSILDDLLEEFRDEILNVTMVDEGAECSPTKDLEELKILLVKDPQSHYTKIQKPSRNFTRLLGPPSGLKGLLHTLNATVIPKKVMHMRGARILIKLRGSVPNRTSWMLYMRMMKLLVMVDVARGSRLRAWL